MQILAKLPSAKASRIYYNKLGKLSEKWVCDRALKFFFSQKIRNVSLLWRRQNFFFGTLKKNA
jgi:hypothetical protein